ncbi:MAG TPA: hypothetical protein VM369_01135 [Candidatus Binatia bacterium]|nr:hypothetical protein [Candidatus Binatia bacterium]
MRVWMAVTALAVASAAGAAEPKRIQCWTDDKGQRMCGDSVPPQYAGQKREILNERGQVVETRRGAPTAEELAEDSRRQRAAEEAKKREQYDRSLLQTYRSVRDLESMRAERLEFIDGRINAAKKSLDDNERTLTDLNERAATQQKEKGKIDERLARQLRDFERSKQRNQRSMVLLQKERDETQTNFDRDIVRFRELRGEEPATSPPKPGMPKPADMPQPTVPPAPAAEPAKK